MTIRINLPTRFTGVVMGIQFTGGSGSADSLGPNAREFFRIKGATLTEDVSESVEPDAPAYPDGDPNTDWTRAQIIAWAQAHNITTRSGMSKDDLLAAVVDTTEPDDDDDPDEAA